LSKTGKLARGQMKKEIDVRARCDTIMARSHTMPDTAALIEFLQALDMETRIALLLALGGVYEHVQFGEVRVTIGDATPLHVYVQSDRKFGKVDLLKLQTQTLPPR
jgi:hypothetical protein